MSWYPTEEAGIRAVVEIPDNDDPGRQHAQLVARSVYTSKLDVKIVDPSQPPAQGDLSNFLDSGGTLEQLNDLSRSVHDGRQTCTRPLLLPFA